MTKRTTSNPRKLVMVAAGGTGGHIFPAIAFMEAMHRQGRYRLALISDRRALSSQDAASLPLASLPLSLYRIHAAGVSGRKGLRFVAAAVLLLFGLVQSFRILRKARPAVVIGFGGYAALPPILAANLTKIPTVLHEQNAVLGRANRLLLPGADRIALSFRATRHVESAEQKGVAVWTGNPVRMDFRRLKGVRYDAKSLRGGMLQLLVLGGSQGARLFGTLVPQALATLPDAMRARLRVCHQVRDEQLSQASDFYAAHAIHAETSSFFPDMAERMSKAHLVICRAGAATLAELATLGRPAILIPFPHAIDDHQRENALRFARAGAGWMMPEESLSSAILSQKIVSLLTHSDFLLMAAGCAHRLAQESARGFAEERLVALVHALLEEEAHAKKSSTKSSKKSYKTPPAKTSRSSGSDRSQKPKSLSKSSSESSRRTA